jgi:predicted RNase H-like HicB family nuclease
VSELIFLVEEAPEGGYTARALGQSIFTEADTLSDLRANIREALECHFEDGQAPPSCVSLEKGEIIVDPV